VENIVNITNNAEKCIDIYHDDIEKYFIEEVVQFKNIIAAFLLKTNHPYLILKNLSYNLSVEIALRISCYLALMSPVNVLSQF